MISLSYISSLIDEFVDRYSFRTDIEYRLPAPIASTSAYNKLWSIFIKKIPSHLHPREICSNAKSVVVFAIPLSRYAVESNKYGRYPSIQWLKEYLYTNRLISELVEYISKYLKRLGYYSVGIKPTHEFSRVNLRARWSHRHAGYIAGLGTFGLNNLLITEMGCAVRLGSIITEASIEESEKPRYEYCLAKRGVKCTACIDRCPINALSDWTTGRFKCYQWLESIDRRYRLLLGGCVDACGKCSTGVPCALKIP